VVFLLPEEQTPKPVIFFFQIGLPIAEISCLFFFWVLRFVVEGGKSVVLVELLRNVVLLPLSVILFRIVVSFEICVVFIVEFGFARFVVVKTRFLWLDDRPTSFSGVTGIGDDNTVEFSADVSKIKFDCFGLSFWTVTFSTAKSDKLAFSLFHFSTSADIKTVVSLSGGFFFRTVGFFDEVIFGFRNVSFLGFFVAEFVDIFVADFFVADFFVLDFFVLDFFVDDKGASLVVSSK